MNKIVSDGQALLDQAYVKLLGNGVFEGMDDLALGLGELRSKAAFEEWRRFSQSACSEHPVKGLLHQDPLTRRAFEKPRGYPGDAELLDFIYGNVRLPGDTSRLGAEVYEYLSQTPECRSVRARRDLIASMIDEIAVRIEKPRVLSVACGHLREAHRSKAVSDGRVGEYIGLDSDPATLAVVQGDLSSKGIKAFRCSVKSLLKGNYVFADFDLVYSLGLYDYLAQPVATELTSLIFRMLRTGGKLLIANFAPGLRDVGYMETFMDWWLAYRGEVELEDTASGIPPDQIREKRTFSDQRRNIVFFEVTKR